LDNHLKGIIELCSKNIELCLKYKKSCDEEKPFNIILASSESYYLENYHSDIIAYILSHKKEYIELFINYLNTFDINNINVENYVCPKITREKEGRIDILIKNDDPKHAIIIENKIHNAVDTRRQLPNYYDSLNNKEYTVDAIIYLSIDGTKRPDTTTWEKKDYKILDKITYCAVSNQSEKDLINGFLKKCFLLEEHNIRESSFFKQYIDLLLYLRRNQMNIQLMEKFYEQMKSDENYDTALSLKSMLNDLATYRRDRIREKFENKHKPFLNYRIYSAENLVFEIIPEISSEEKICINLVFF